MISYITNQMSVRFLFVFIFIAYFVKSVSSRERCLTFTKYMITKMNPRFSNTRESKYNRRK
ncbi:hypothetical protein GLOIN_2v1669546 [Rhizophagus irregularis DAOM 181602=DAOM 197198]|uniref:Uncharacterized protein n=1 Tax=Rhizophagus irregularis (strain DAOM 181602 / DAOM 197198 / MUCL 43194) TaxID=747089 RepID=A0A2P4PIB5_RHIID|nr:hypothetical protein GLOIN_2v1669546 [Rhizophagus irregularis DAOM 181602=DAOM 197198]POG65131.1 hypothetical protein GLOIN_2v1669546 [Rhizophagus irregularis DAOM 181602=DAOM 197198]|eukprot:XP_025171997.1 hypothetical protein GLOIN_2v1669546 [Rhizophagus irregularis DAOM 181602=DAOM 197198]